MEELLKLVPARYEGLVTLLTIMWTKTFYQRPECLMASLYPILGTTLADEGDEIHLDLLETFAVSDRPLLHVVSAS